MQKWIIAVDEKEYTLRRAWEPSVFLVVENDVISSPWLTVDENSYPRLQGRSLRFGKNVLATAGDRTPHGSST
jgi:hypothetical protein